MASTAQFTPAPTAGRRNTGSGPVRRPTGQSHRAQLVDAANFVLAIRDSGYKSSALAIAEFIDNAIQAGARHVEVAVAASREQGHPLELLVTDDGFGMDEATLSSALAFGGSSRFGDRSSLGRYGMGLPSSALSRARRVEVYTWQGQEVLTARLDVDEVNDGRQQTLSPIEHITRPPFVPATAHGTTVRLQRCDRLEYRRVAALAHKLKQELGRIYRHFLAAGLDLRVNGCVVDAIDPMFLHVSAKGAGGRQFGDLLTYHLTGVSGAGKVAVRFSELPVDRWHSLSSEEKRQLGVTNGPCVSILRANREIDRGWYFMGAKRRENYDDWWRCEVSFDPTLDELFGVAQSKQAISPTDRLLKVLVPDLEAIARALNSRVRHRFELMKVTAPLGAAEKQAAKADAALPPLPRRPAPLSEELSELLKDCRVPDEIGSNPYEIVVTELPSTAAFEVVTRRGQLVLLFNARHPLYRDLYGPLARSDSEKDQEVAKRMALVVLAAARAEAGTRGRGERDIARRLRQTWADVLATFFNA